MVEIVQTGRVAIQQRIRAHVQVDHVGLEIAKRFWNKASELVAFEIKII
jgi:hypothetical protein